ncbi:hypothetical protein P280DRAFT_472898 [Massarina eburnea CBS 473.64]|uniref:Uncharacterized protein n=1 Tax=Massarina eburnea CBS 473.64 TaxID=1395130 RepID=A0A6A6RRM9_9PLEO|nr:hypothetical protein P280DRAFT_472898 [Massarina eburnea CBS 473.64]
MIVQYNALTLDVVPKPISRFNLCVDRDAFWDGGGRHLEYAGLRASLLSETAVVQSPLAVVEKVAKKRPLRYKKKGRCPTVRPSSPTTNLPTLLTLLQQALERLEPNRLLRTHSIPSCPTPPPLPTAALQETPAAAKLSHRPWNAGSTRNPTTNTFTDKPWGMGPRERRAPEAIVATTAEGRAH